ncbi:MAG: class I SAM-dependent methyltransferase [Acaryochloris sp. RU_4_1]|nr:class I SAM-dependent methyltransferase [Acaryochloris sp. RU_4_1]NJR57175.1 class I SAM-dependent methyltransferase [Acaryochloris sp. CRU_2_0]
MTEVQVRQQYDSLASVYDQQWNWYVTNTLSFLKTWVNLSVSETVLDIACGTGEFERMVLRENPNQQIVGVDISEEIEMLAIARQKLHNYANVAFQVGSASALSVSDQSFDVIISANAFHDFDDPAAALAEMKRVLKPNGKVVTLDWCKDFWLCRICDALLQRTDPAHQQCCTQREFHDFLTSSGFNIDASGKACFGIVWGLMVATAVPQTIEPAE